MKKAGAKNDGAWYRANRAIGKLTDSERTNLAGLIAASHYIQAFFNDLTAFSSQSGITFQSGTPAGPQDLALTYATKGIPRQVWMGRLTFTTYGSGGHTGPANYQSAIHYFAKDLRRIVRNYFFTLRELKDVLDIGDISTGNPGGLPDDNPAN